MYSPKPAEFFLTYCKIDQIGAGALVYFSTQWNCEPMHACKKSWWATQNLNQDIFWLNFQKNPSSALSLQQLDHPWWYLRCTISCISYHAVLPWGQRPSYSAVLFHSRCQGPCSCASALSDKRVPQFHYHPGRDFCGIILKILDTKINLQQGIKDSSVRRRVSK